MYWTGICTCIDNYTIYAAHGHYVAFCYLFRISNRTYILKRLTIRIHREHDGRDLLDPTYIQSTS